MMPESLVVAVLILERVLLFTFIFVLSITTWMIESFYLGMSSQENSLFDKF